MLGNIVNFLAIIVGSLIGLLIHSKLPNRVTKIVFQALGVFTIFLGIKMALDSNELLLMILSLVLGSAIGGLIDLDAYLTKFTDWVKGKVKFKNPKFTEGFTTSTLLYCVGAMAIIGSFEEGLKNDSSLLLTKSVMDGFSAIMLSAVFGIGVLFSAIPTFLYQGTLTLSAGFLEPYLSDAVLTEISAVGGLLIIGIGLNLMEIVKVKVLNMLPALLIIVLLIYFSNWLMPYLKEII